MLFKRSAWMVGGAVALAVLSGCANLRGVTSDVTSYSNWPAERKPASYAFERLPSQQAQPEQQDQLERAARRALEEAGFTEATDSSAAAYAVQLGTRIGQYDRGPYYGPYDRYGFYGGYGPGRFYGPGFGLGMRWDTPYYEREVSVLIRDRKTGQSLYESRARNDGTSYGSPETLEAMYQAALKDFPQPAVNPRRVLIDNSK
jgi:hypothetical protein